MKRVTSRKPRSDLLAAIHETARDLHRAGVMDIETMREFDALCLTARRPALDRTGSRRHKSRTFGPSADDP